MVIDFLQTVNIVKELGGLGLLLVLVIYGLPKVIALFLSLSQAIDRNTRMTYHLATSLGAPAEKGSDILKEMPDYNGQKGA